MTDSHKRLKSYLDRIIRLHEERKSLSDDIGEIYKEAKATGYDRKAMVATVKRLMGDESAFAELDQLTDLYLRAYRSIGTEVAFTHARAPALDTTAPAVVAEGCSQDDPLDIPAFLDRRANLAGRA